MSDIFGEGLIRAPKTTKAQLVDVIEQAAKAAFRKANIGVPPTHEIFADLRNYAREKSSIKPNSEVEHSAPARGARIFARELRIQLTKLGVIEEFNSRMDVVAKGSSIVITKKAEKKLPPLPSTVGMTLDKAVEVAIEAGGRAAGVDTTSRVWKNQIKEFMRGCRLWLKAKKEGYEHAGATFYWPIPKSGSSKFALAFYKALNVKGPKELEQKYGISIQPKTTAGELAMYVIVPRYAPAEIKA